MIFLKNGITGFGFSKIFYRNTFDCNVNVSLFHNQCEMIAEFSYTAYFDGYINSYDDYSFHYSLFEMREKDKTFNIAILLNKYYRYTAAVEVNIADLSNSLMNLSFIDMPDEFVNILSEDFIVLNKNELEQYPKNIFTADEPYSNLSESEISELKKWDPKSFGRIIFNNWQWWN